MTNTKSLKKLGLVILDTVTPSTLGIVVYVLVFLITVVDDQIEPYKNAILSLKLSDFQGTFLYRPMVDIGNFIKLQAISGIVVYAFWIIAGIIIYIIAYRIVSNEREAVEDINMRHYIWPRGSDVNLPIKDYLKSLLFRLAVAVIIIIYVLKGFPVLRVWWQNRHERLLLSGSSIKANLLLLIYETLFLHILVVLLRLFLVRRRLFDTK